MSIIVATCLVYQQWCCDICMFLFLNILSRHVSNMQRSPWYLSKLKHLVVVFVLCVFVCVMAAIVFRNETSCRGIFDITHLVTIWLYAWARATVYFYVSGGFDTKLGLGEASGCQQRPSESFQIHLKPRYRILDVSPISCSFPTNLWSLLFWTLFAFHHIWLLHGPCGPFLTW